jgi:uncharacterized protein (TIGR02246 family)
MQLNFCRSAFWLLANCLILIGTTWAQTKPTVLSAEDSAAVRLVLERYRATWLANDEEGVLSTFATDAILMPAHGSPTVAGMPAIKQYWWAPSTNKTTITKFEQNLDEVGGNESIAYARGTSDVEWSSENKGVTQNWQNDSSFLFLLKRQGDGSWHISHLIWDAGENKRLNDRVRPGQ